MICNKCKANNAPGTRYCANCGAPLGSAPIIGTGDTQVFARSNSQHARGYSEPMQSRPAQQSGTQTTNARPNAAARSPFARPISQQYAQQPMQAEQRPVQQPTQAAQRPIQQPMQPQIPIPNAALSNSARNPLPHPTGAQAIQPDAADATAAPLPELDTSKLRTYPLADTTIAAAPSRAARNNYAPERQASAAPAPEAYSRRRPAPPDYEPEDEIEDDEVEEIFHENHVAYKPHKNRLLISGIAALGVLALCMLAICFVTFTAAGQRWKASIGLNAPASAYWTLGDEALASGSVTNAVNYYEQALGRDSANYDGTMKLAAALKSLGNAERAERAYYKAISIKPTETAPYDSALELMAARGASENELVEMYQLAYQNTNNELYHSQLLTFGPDAVRFEPVGGEYSYAVQLQMASDEGADIYYTTDGSQPTTSSSAYVLPIELGEGTFTVRAIAYKNDLYSEETQQTYTIAFPTVQSPQFTSKPGKYSVESDGQKTIKVSVPDGCTVYYTTDGSEPTKDSKQYSEGISLKLGTHTLRMIAINADGVVSNETSGDYQIIGQLAEAFTDEDRFKSFFLGVTSQEDVNKQFKKLVSTTGDINTFFTQHYSFGEVDFTVEDGIPLVSAVRIINNDITGVRGSKVGWNAEDVIALFRDEKNEIKNGERVLYTMDHDRYGWIEYDSDGNMTSINYMYTRDEVQLVELHYTISKGKVSAMEYCISDM